MPFPDEFCDTLARESELVFRVRAEGEWPLRSVSLELLGTP